MARQGQAGREKRARERAKQEKRKAKLERRIMRNAQRAQNPRPATGEDPDLAGIVPGPQPPQEDY